MIDGRLREWQGRRRPWRAKIGLEADALGLFYHKSVEP